VDKVTCLDWRGGMTLYTVQFDEDGFDNRRFGEAGLVLPDGLHMAVRKRRAGYFFGRLCAQAALAPLGLAHAQVGSGAMGAPLWPAGVVGSITHTSRRAAAIVLRATACHGAGIDIENVADAQSLQAMQGTVISPGEAACLRTCAHDTGILMTLVFSAKESFFKAVSGAANRYFDFDALAVERIDLERRTISFKVTQDLCPQWQAGAHCTIEFDFLGPGEVATLFVW